jgi:hypothetical protein
MFNYGKDALSYKFICLILLQLLSIHRCNSLYLKNTNIFCHMDANKMPEARQGFCCELVNVNLR